jgi:hypothetical protein
VTTDVFYQLEQFIQQAPQRLQTELGDDFSEVLESFFRPSEDDAGYEILSRELEVINAGQAEYLKSPRGEDKRALALILISAQDFDDLLYTKLSVYAHLLKISQLSEHFRVICRTIYSLDLDDETRRLKESYPDRELGYVHVIAHGLNGELCFIDCDEASLILDEDIIDSSRLSVTFEVCTAGDSNYNNCLGRRFAELNPNVLVFAPQQSVLHSVPWVIKHGARAEVSAVGYVPVMGWPRQDLEELIASIQRGEEPRLKLMRMETFCCEPQSA